MSRRLRRAVLVAIVACSTGCRWIPARRGESRPETPPLLGKADADKPSPEDLALSGLPPLPPLRSIDDAEAFRPSAPTPLLDAAAARDAALKRLLAIENDQLASSTRGQIPPVEVRQVATLPDPKPNTGPDTENTPKVDPEVAPAVFDPKSLPVEIPPAGPSEVKVPENPALPPLSEPPPAEVKPVSQNVSDAPSPQESDDPSLWNTVLSALATPPVSEPTVEPLAVAATLPPEFSISDMRLCKKVVGFGRTEPLATSVCKPGQAVLVYCELEGLRDEETGEGFHSRLASTIAIVSASEGIPVWSEDLGIADDHCRRRRRDFFVNYRVTLPTNLPAGEYQVRLVQKDLLADRQATRTLPLTVRP